MTTTLEGVAPAGETAVYYVLYEDGAVGKIETDAGGEPLLAHPGRLVSESAYLARLSVVEEESAAFLAELETGDQARTLADYTALTALGLPEETARRLSGYSDPEPDVPVVEVPDLPDLPGVDVEAG
ncbi:hypothetical protein [Streptomyces sp. NBC_00519]|uniref:hypothetical protein n=1 Tax=Streptomyces sp. NBC_00519 TaxID=2975764 RepID=UPI0030E05D8C